MLPIFNEYQYAVNMNNGHAEDREQEDKRLYNFRELVVYTKWLRWSLWAADPDGPEKDKKVYNGLVTFCDQLLSHFNISVDYRMIQDVLKKSSEFKLRTNNPAYITRREWDQILMLPDDLSRRTYFALLVLCKFNRNNPVVSVKQKTKEYDDIRFRISYLLSDIYKYAGIKFGRKVVAEDPKIIYNPIITLVKEGLIESYFARGKCSIILLNADVNPDPDDVYMTITDYNCPDNYYRYGMREKCYKVCEHCGRAFKDNKHNNSKYCSSCSDRGSDMYVYKHCVDCGKRIRVLPTSTRTKRCIECQKKKKMADNQLRKMQVYAQNMQNSV